MNRFRNYQLTFNNPIEHGISKDMLIEILNNVNVKYACGKEEIGSETNTHHMHIFIIFNNGKTFNAVKKIFENKGNPHIEICKGSIQENIDYIMKEETSIENTFFEIGERPKGQGTRTDISLIKEKIENGYNTFDIIDEYPNLILQYDKIEMFVKANREREYSIQERDVKVTYIYGNPGTGKTRYVIDKHGYKDMYRITNYKNPFDNYQGQDVIVFDEYRSQLDFSAMLNYLDRYPCTLPCRFKDTTACFTNIYIISNIPIEQQYKDNCNYIDNTSANWNALIRRIHNYIDMISEDDKKIYYGYELYKRGIGITLEEHEKKTLSKDEER